MNSAFLSDGYKTGHHKQYPKGTTKVYSNWTPRSNKYAPEGCDKVLSFGQQYMIRWLHEHFEKNFFSKPKDEVCQEIKSELSLYLGDDYDVSHFERLHELGYLPILVKAIEEGKEVPIRVPMLTIVNTIHEFYWITNFLETIISNTLWLPMTSATIALKYKRIFKAGLEKTHKEMLGFEDFQGHDFSMRGLEGLQGTILASIGHCAVFKGSDSLPVIPSLRKYYDAVGFICGSVNATEHSVMCAGGKEDELATFRHLMEVHPTGILSIVSDTWDLWKVLTETLPILKDEIMKRDGKIVIRPDSGNPSDIICGDGFAKEGTPQHKGVIELLWETFGGTINEQGYKVLDPHIGAIYGDSITPDLAVQIINGLETLGFASSNIVFGIGSFTYQLNTRDTFGFAMKATYVAVDGEGRAIFKDPVTDDGVKKSAKGLVCVNLDDDGDYILIDGCSKDQERRGQLKPIYEDGQFVIETNLDEVRANVEGLL